MKGEYVVGEEHMVRQSPIFGLIMPNLYPIFVYNWFKVRKDDGTLNEVELDSTAHSPMVPLRTSRLDIKYNGVEFPSVLAALRLEQY